MAESGVERLTPQLEQAGELTRAELIRAEATKWLVVVASASLGVAVVRGGRRLVHAGLRLGDALSLRAACMEYTGASPSDCSRSASALCMAPVSRGQLAGAMRTVRSRVRSRGRTRARDWRAPARHAAGARPGHPAARRSGLYRSSMQFTSCHRGVF